MGVRGLAVEPRTPVGREETQAFIPRTKARRGVGGGVTIYGLYVTTLAGERGARGRGGGSRGWLR